MIKWIGLTGGIATGKSTVAKIIKDSGFAVINADEVAHQALSPQTPFFKDLVQTFGQDVLDQNGQIDRRRLGAKIFKDEALRLQLESFVHPYVRQKVSEYKLQLQSQGHKMAFYDVPLLFEKNMQADFNKIIVVWCDSQKQLARLIQRNSLSPIEAQQRIAAQLPMDIKKSQADFVIDNNSDLEHLKSQTLAVLAQLK